MTKEDRIYDLLFRKGQPMTAREITDVLYDKHTHQSVVFSKLQDMVHKGQLVKFDAIQPYSFSINHMVIEKNSIQKLKDQAVVSNIEKTLHPQVTWLKVNSTILDSLHNFFKYMMTNNIEIYNEFSLQHELGIYLRGLFPEYKVQFERNVSFFNGRYNTIKKEIDIVMYNLNTGEKYAIELKAPINGQYPEQMYSFVKDIKFMEELKEGSFTNTFSIVLVGDRPFYQGNVNNGIYKYFRDEHLVYGRIGKPTGNGKDNEHINLHGTYKIDWCNVGEMRRYYIVAI